MFSFMRVAAVIVSLHSRENQTKIVSKSSLQKIILFCLSEYFQSPEEDDALKLDLQL